MKKTEKPSGKTISQAIRNQITIDIPEEDMDGLIDECDDLCSQSYDAGYNLGMVDGALEYESENPPVNEEKSNSEYVTEIFADCTTFDEFKTIYNEIRNLSYTYMK